MKAETKRLALMAAITAGLALPALADNWGACLAQQNCDSCAVMCMILGDTQYERGLRQ